MINSAHNSPTHSQPIVSLTPEQQAMQSAQLFRSFATPSCFTTPAKKREIDQLLMEAKANGLLETFEGINDWIRNDHVKKARVSDIKHPLSGENTPKTADPDKNTSPRQVQKKQALTQAKRMIVTRPPVDGTLPPFVYSDNNTRVMNQTILIKEIEVIPENDAAGWQKLLDKLVEEWANPLVTTWISEHVLYLSMTVQQQALRQTAQKQWQRLGRKQFNPVYASKQDLFAFLIRK